MNYLWKYARHATSGWVGCPDPAYPILLDSKLDKLNCSLVGKEKENGENNNNNKEEEEEEEEFQET